MASKKDEVIAEILKQIAPGTPIRNGLENILKAKTGALIAVGGDTKEVLELVDGGFKLDVEYTSSRLYELAKMDGAIVLSSDLKRILYANAQLIPSSEILTTETGTRHRTAERTAKQTGALVISISQRRGIITLFKGNSRYVLKDLEAVLSQANQALQTVEKYKKVFDSKLNLLNEYEFNDIVTLENVIIAIQRAEMVMRVADEVNKAIDELGEEGRLLEMQLDELVGDFEKEELLIIKDYIAPGKKRTCEKVLEEIKKLGGEVNFNSKLEKINIKEGNLKSIIVNGKEVSCETLILAISSKNTCDSNLSGATYNIFISFFAASSKILFISILFNEELIYADLIPKLFILST